MHIYVEIRFLINKLLPAKQNISHTRLTNNINETNIITIAPTQVNIFLSTSNIKYVIPMTMLSATNPAKHTATQNIIKLNEGLTIDIGIIPFYFRLFFILINKLQQISKDDYP